MNSAIKDPRAASLWFVGLVLCVYAVALVVVDAMPRLADAGALIAAVTVDLVVTVPLAFYLLVVRPRGMSPLRVAPVVVGSVVLASLVIPRDQQQTLHWLEMLVVPLEIGVLGWVVWRASRALQKVRRGVTDDPLQRFHRAALELFGNDRIAGIFTSEIGIFYYGLTAWREKPHVPTGSLSFSHHQRSGQGGVVFAFLVLMAGEGFVAHLLLAKWQVVVAWLFTASTVYGALWLIADLRACILRPVVISEDEIVFRAGLRQTLVVKRALVSRVTRSQPDPSQKDCLSLKLMGPPSHWVHLVEPVLARGAYGRLRWVSAVGLEPDDPAEFERVLAGQPI